MPMTSSRTSNRHWPRFRLGGALPGGQAPQPYYVDRSVPPGPDDIPPAVQLVQEGVARIVGLGAEAQQPDGRNGLRRGLARDRVQLGARQRGDPARTRG